MLYMSNYKQMQSEKKYKNTISKMCHPHVYSYYSTNHEVVKFRKPTNQPAWCTYRVKRREAETWEMTTGMLLPIFFIFNRRMSRNTNFGSHRHLAGHLKLFCLGEDYSFSPPSWTSSPAAVHDTAYWSVPPLFKPVYWIVHDCVATRERRSFHQDLSSRPKKSSLPFS